MPRVETIASDEDDDIWGYRTQCAPKSAVVKSQKHSQSQVVSNTNQKPKKPVTKKRPSTHNKKRKKSVMVKKEEKNEETPDKRRSVDRSGRCPVCQMPFTLLSKIETPSWHVDQCLDTPYSSKIECEKGLDCDSEISSHYKKFHHTELARSGRKNSSNKTDSQKTLGNVDSAKVKLTFDVGKSDGPLSAFSDEVICIDSDEDSSEDFAFDDRKSPSIDSDIDSKINLKNKASLLGNKAQRKSFFDRKTTASTSNKTNGVVVNKAASVKIEMFNCHSNIYGKKEICKNEVNDSDSDETELPEINELGNTCSSSSADFIKIEPKDLGNDDDNYNSDASSVHDIIDVFDETREVSDMIADALGDDTDNASQVEEVDSGRGAHPVDKVDKPYNEQATSGGDIDNDLFGSISDSEFDTCSSLLLDVTSDDNVKSSAIPKLRETPAKSRSESLSSSDWEILSSTLTPSSDNINKHGTKDLIRKFGSCKKKNKLTCDSEIENIDKNAKVPSGFFAKKLKLNAEKSNETCADSTKKSFSFKHVQKSSDHKDDTGDILATCSYHAESERKVSEDKIVNYCGPKLIISDPTTSSGKILTHIGSKRTDSTDVVKHDISDQTKKPKLENHSTVNKCSNVATKSKNKNKTSIKIENSTTKKGGHKSVASYFTAKHKKQVAVTIVTDDESSEEWDKFCDKNKCCDMCAKNKPNMCQTKVSPNMCQTRVSPNMCQTKVSLNMCQTENKPNMCQTKMPSKSGSKQSTCDFPSTSLCTVRLESLLGNKMNYEKSHKTSPKFVSDRLLPGPSGDNLESGNDLVNTRLKSAESQTRNMQSREGSSTKHVGDQETALSQSQSMHSGNTPHFAIDNICTVSPYTYSILQGGFIPEGEDNDDQNVEPITTKLAADQDNKEAVSNSQTSQTSSASLPSTFSEDSEIQSILKIRKSATDILMESSKLLCKKNKALAAGIKTETKTINDMLMQRPGCSVAKIPKMTAENNKGKGRGWYGRKTATDSEDTKPVARKCPFYKKMPGTSFTVDAFRYGNIPDCKAYILSHFHYDHYGGLTKHFRQPIYCSKITGNLVQKKIGVDPQYIHTIPLNKPTVIEQVEITFLEANHCPGAVLILFKLKSGKVFLHTGDFRACQQMEYYPELQNLRVNSLYLDTTYCDPQYDFPAQADVIKFTVKLVLETLTNNPKTLIVCGSYTIGKERIFMAIAKALNCKVCMNRDKQVVMECLEKDEWKQTISLKWEDSGLHVLPMNKLNIQGLQDHLSQRGKKFTHVLGIEPTGWTHNKKVLSLHHIKPKQKRDNVTIYGVPYSEHSSYLEMKRFCQFIKPIAILPTVNNGSPQGRAKMEAIFESWSNENMSNSKRAPEQQSVKDWMT